MQMYWVMPNVYGMGYPGPWLLCRNRKQMKTAEELQVWMFLITVLVCQWAYLQKEIRSPIPPHPHPHPNPILLFVRAAKLQYLEKKLPFTASTF